MLYFRPQIRRAFILCNIWSIVYMTKGTTEAKQNLMNKKKAFLLRAVCIFLCVKPVKGRKLVETVDYVFK